MDTVAGLDSARALLSAARADAADLHRRVAALATATAWQARAAEGYRTALDRLAGDLARLVALIDSDDDHLVALRGRALAAVPAVAPAGAGWP